MGIVGGGGSEASPERRGVNVINISPKDWMTEPQTMDG